VRRAPAQENATGSDRDRARARLPPRGRGMRQAAQSIPGWRNSLGLRLVAGTLCWVAVALVVAGWGLSALFAEHVTRQFRTELGTHFDQLAAAIEFGADGTPRLRAPLGDPRLARPYSGLYWQV